VWDAALERARTAQERVTESRRTGRAEQELRDSAIVDAYELGCPVQRIASAVGIGRTTVLNIIASS